MTNNNNDKKISLLSEKEELSIGFTQDYRVFLTALKDKIRNARLKAALAINKEMIDLYWHLGNQIIEKQNWGSKLIETLSHDLQNAFPETSGFSVRNLHRMRQFASRFSDITILPQAVAQLPWGHISLLIHKIKDNKELTWYAEQTIEQGWTRVTLEHQIKDNLFKRQAIDTVKASNFLTRLPSPQSRLAHELLKQPYNFDFLGLHDDAHEREIEHASIEHITKFLLELGKGFAFVGRQVPIGLEESGYFIDMLFYHLKLHAYVVIEWKAVRFKPEHAGQLNFYLNLVDDFYKTPEDNPTIGLLLCKFRNKFEAEYALKGIEKPIGISEYQLTKAIPESLKKNLPTIAEIEAELNNLEGNYDIDYIKSTNDFTQLNLISDRIKLIPICMEYAKDICSNFTAEITRYMWPSAPKTQEEINKHILTQQDQMKNREEISLLIIEKKSGEFLGYASIHQVKSKTPELGIWLKKSAHRHNYGYEAMNMLKNWAECNLHYDYLKYPVDKKNIASRKLATKLGGIIGDEYLKTSESGKILDEVEYRFYLD